MTCPRCATRYFVADRQVGPDGRRVRCAECRELWIAQPTSEPATGEEPPPPPARPSAIPSMFAAPPKAPKPLVAPVFVRWRRPATLALAVAVLIVVAFLFRAQIFGLGPG
ncbi:MAG: MJ0042-type zinc finger domain-containing protein [Caulobacteraceae bacterium]